MTIFYLLRLFIRELLFGSRKTPLSGKFTGWLTLSNGHHDYFQLTVAEDDYHTLKILGGASGDDCGPISLDGTVSGDCFQVFGQIGGTATVFDCQLVENTNAIQVCDATGKELGIWRRVEA